MKSTATWYWANWRQEGKDCAYDAMNRVPRRFDRGRLPTMREVNESVTLHKSYKRMRTIAASFPPRRNAGGYIYFLNNSPALTAYPFEVLNPVDLEQRTPRQVNVLRTK